MHANRDFSPILLTKIIIIFGITRRKLKKCAFFLDFLNILGEKWMIGGLLRFSDSRLGQYITLNQARNFIFVIYMSNYI